MRWDAALYLLHSLLLFSLANLCWAFIETRGCNRTVRNSVGWIRWTGRMGRCVVRIRAPLRDPQVIEVKIRRMLVGSLKEARCEGAYVQFSDGAEDVDEEAGRYCGHVTGNATRLLLRNGPDLTITLDSTAQFAAANPVIFSAQYSVLPARLAAERHRGFSQPTASDCPLECSVRDDRRTCRLSSPGFPGVYPRGVRCRVALQSGAGRFEIGGLPDDSFSLMNYTSQSGCRTENCEEHVESAARVSRRRRHPDRDEEDEFIISHASRERKRDHRRKQKAGDSGATSPYGQREQRNGPGAFDGEDQGARLDSLGKRRRHEKRMRKKSMSVARFHLDGSSGKTRKGPGAESIGLMQVPEYRHARRMRLQERLGSPGCVGDYIALLENVNGKMLEVSKFCGEGRVPRILSRGRNVIVEFFAEREGTVMHDGFQLTVQESELTAGASHERGCEFVYKSSERARETIRSPRSWYPPNTLCSYRFLGKPSERISVHVKIVRNEPDREPVDRARNFSLNYCHGNEIVVYNGARANDSQTMWSYCDSSHRDINNIQIPLTSHGSEMLIQYYSARGSYNGEEFTYAISYRFVRRVQNTTSRRQVQEDLKLISLRPVNFSALNLNESENCNCDFGDRIGTFKNWFMVLVVLGVVSFLGAVLTIIALLAKCFKLRSMEKKLLQTPKR